MNYNETYMEHASIQNINGHAIHCVVHEAKSKNIVIFCHGFRSSSIGPNRFFVRAARLLADKGIATIRFDQFGSGNSAGDFIESSFTDWVETIKVIARMYQAKGYKVTLFGQSMGGSAVICAGAELNDIASIVSWVPDPSEDTFIEPTSGHVEESGQRVTSRFWREAHNAKIAEQLAKIEYPVYIIQCSKDDYVSPANQQVLQKHAKTQHVLELFEGLSHSSWTFDEATEIISKSVDFIITQFEKSR